MKSSNIQLCTMYNELWYICSTIQIVIAYQTKSQIAGRSDNISTGKNDQAPQKNNGISEDYWTENLR